MFCGVLYPSLLTLEDPAEVRGEETQEQVRVYLYNSQEDPAEVRGEETQVQVRVYLYNSQEDPAEV